MIETLAGLLALCAFISLCALTGWAVSHLKPFSEIEDFSEVFILGFFTLLVGCLVTYSAYQLGSFLLHHAAP
jgi:hypothetical protein